MNGLRYKLAAFMQGRNGADQLSVFALIVYAVIAFIRIFLRRYPIAYYIAGALMTLTVVYIVFRVLSTNISKRHMENEAFLRFWYRIKPKFVLMKDRLKDIKTKRYRTCPGCKNVLRLPYSRGKHSVVCPKCGTKFDVRII